MPSRALLLPGKTRLSTGFGSNPASRRSALATPSSARSAWKRCVVPKRDCDGFLFAESVRQGDCRGQLDVGADRLLRQRRRRLCSRARTRQSRDRTQLSARNRRRRRPSKAHAEADRRGVEHPPSAKVLSQTIPCRLCHKKRRKKVGHGHRIGDSYSWVSDPFCSEMSGGSAEIKHGGGALLRSRREAQTPAEVLTQPRDEIDPDAAARHEFSGPRELRIDRR